MIRLKDSLHVAADQVAEVEVSSDRDVVVVRMKDGRTHSVGCDYGKSVWATGDRLVALIRSQVQRGQEQ